MQALQTCLYALLAAPTTAKRGAQNVSRATQEGFLCQTSSSRALTLEILHSLLLLSATHLEFKGY